MILFLDIETQNDWKSGESFKTENLKISFVGVVDDQDKEYGFWENEMDKLHELMKQAELIVHYNGFSFDMPVIANYLGSSVMDMHQIDLMVAAHKKIGFRPKLGDLATATLGYGKSGSGADALEYWKNQDLESLRKYCLQDVRVTKDLYYHGLTNRTVKYYDRSGFLQTTDIDWTLGEKLAVASSDDMISMF